ncbi:MAG: ATPase [Alistipes sp.]|nr:ATPase [Alistipes sp.]
MILIADSGSTKTEWGIVENGRIVQNVATRGMNPFFQGRDEIIQCIKEDLLPIVGDKAIRKILFYGAGCAFPDKISIIREILLNFFSSAQIEVGSDMLGAARALCLHEKGIACILGTGSNSCFYDGEKICNNVSPLGFILGDEGSGAVLGRELVSDCLKHQLPESVCQLFFDRYNLTPADILEQVYRRPTPNRFLASLSPFLIEHIEIPEIHDLVLRNFSEFLQRNVLQYPEAQDCEIHFVGSIAYYYKETLAEALQAKGLRQGLILRTPLHGLVRYHADQDQATSK